MIVVHNKADLYPPGGGGAQGAIEALLPRSPVVALSAREGTGIAELETTLYDLATGGAGSLAADGDPALATVRQRETLARARDHARHAAEAFEAGVPLDLVAIDARAALAAVGEITGETVSEAVLEAIFSRFCIGK